MTNPIIRIHDLATGKIVDREMTDTEYQDFINPKPTPSLIPPQAALSTPIVSSDE
jgi:hypothetical protein